MTTITDEYMQQMLAKTRNYTIAILKAGPQKNDDSDVRGLYIFHAAVKEVQKIMDEDPGVKAGVFVYEIHPCRSFPGDSLPG